MRTPDIPESEPVRLGALQTFDILDTEPEERFDRITRICKNIFEVPIALVSLVDSERQWFKSKQGLEACETGRDISFCGHAILGEDIFIINDASKDERFADNPLVTDAPNIRFYAGCPLHVYGSQRIGTLCLIDDKPREISNEDQDLLRYLASIVEREIRDKHLAKIDQLTGLANFKGLESVYAELTTGDTGRKLTSVVVQINNYKYYDRKCGEIMQRTLGDILKERLGDTGIVAHTNPEEFVCILYNSDAGATNVNMSDVRQMLEDHKIQCGKDYPMSISYGIYEKHADMNTELEDLISITMSDLEQRSEAA